jgi:hypothetical protein
MPNGRCRMHGGTNSGAPLTAGGRHSKFLPVRLQARYQEALKDPELIALQADVALIDTRLAELLERLDTTETSAAWMAANKLFREMSSSDPAKSLAARHALGEVLEKGLADVAAWSEIAGLLEQRRKCAESESKRQAQLDQFITAKQANVLMAAILHLVTENVADPTARARIAQGLVGLVNHGDQPGAGSTTN